MVIDPKVFIFKITGRMEGSIMTQKCKNLSSDVFSEILDEVRINDVKYQKIHA